MLDINKQIAMVFQNHGVHYKGIKSLLRNGNDSGNKDVSRYNLRPEAKYVSINKPEKPTQPIKQMQLVIDKYDIDHLMMKSYNPNFSITEQYLDDHILYYNDMQIIGDLGWY